MSVEQLITYFNKFIPLTEIEKNALIARIRERRVKRRQFVLQQNEVCKHYTFVVSGCFKMYAVDQSGTEHNLQFAAENEWITDIGSFHSGKETQLYIEAIEPSVVLQLEKTDLIYLYHNHQKFDRIFRVIVENEYVELQNRVLQNISSTAQERYSTFLIQYAFLASRLPNTQIASYLGITPEFLSKIRAKNIKI